MTTDSPTRIAIVGAGPIGLEAALYGRFLGFEIDVFERGKVAENIANWQHVELFSPWAMNMSPLGREAIEAQNPRWSCPAEDELPTGRDFIDRYLLPLAESDLVADGLRERAEVLRIGRAGLLKGERIGDSHRADTPFRLLVQHGDGQQQVHHADIVIDASGTYGNHNALGVGGLPAMGELENASRIDYGLPDFEGADRERFADRHTLIVGGGYSAATNVVALAKLAERFRATRVTWLTRGTAEDAPLARIADDRLTARDNLARAANARAKNAEIPVAHFAATSVERIEYQSECSRFRVTLGGQHPETIQVDRIIANVGYRPDTSLYSELQVHTCYASEGPMKLAAVLMDDPSADCLDQKTVGPEVLLNPEPNFYVIGSKSYGRNSRFLISAGLKQIRDVFTIIGDRVDLDLYWPPQQKLASESGP